MTSLLIQIGIVLVPFYDIVFRLFPYINISINDTRPQRDVISLWIAILLALYGLYQGKIKANNDKWLLTFLGFMFIVSFQFASGMPFVINGVQTDSFWLWRPMFYSLIYFLAYLTIINTQFTIKEIDRILKTICISSGIMSVYVLLQFYGVDQFFAVKPELALIVTSAKMAGFLGQPTLVSPLIALSIPILLYLKWDIWAIFSTVIVFLINSQVAIGSLIVAIAVYHILRKPEAVYFWATVGIGFVIYLLINPRIMGDSGRFAAWSMILMDWTSSSLSGQNLAITGKGIGSFQYIFHAVHNSIFYQAHNEYLEILYWGGIIGIALFAAVLLNIFSRAYSVFRQFADNRMALIVALISSFVCICLCAGGTFVWQLGVYRIYTVVILGILLNNGLKRGIA